jgi:hypothetical protein
MRPAHFFPAAAALFDAEARPGADSVLDGRAEAGASDWDEASPWLGTLLLQPARNAKSRARALTLLSFAACKATCKTETPTRTREFPSQRGRSGIKPAASFR